MIIYKASATIDLVAWTEWPAGPWQVFDDGVSGVHAVPYSVIYVEWKAKSYIPYRSIGTRCIYCLMKWHG